MHARVRTDGHNPFPYGSIEAIDEAFIDLILLTYSAHRSDSKEVRTKQASSRLGRTISKPARFQTTSLETGAVHEYFDSSAKSCDCMENQKQSGAEIQRAQNQSVHQLVPPKALKVVP